MYVNLVFESIKLKKYWISEMAINENNIGIIKSSLDLAAVFDDDGPNNENMIEALKLVIFKSLKEGVTIDEIVSLLDEAKSENILDG